MSDSTSSVTLPAELPVACCPSYTVTRAGLFKNKRGRKMHPQFNTPYPTVSMGGRTRNVHVLVCETFHGPRPCDDCQVHHRDRNRRNFAADNLEWKTFAEHRAVHPGKGWNGKPAKPAPDFPLHPEPNGNWAKSVKGRRYYFGPIKDDPNGDCAMKDWKARRQSIEAGTERRVSVRERRRQRFANCGRADSD